MRWLWFALGWLMVGLGVIGALLPVMPTTIFLILAVGCFARSSPKFEQRLLAHPRYGPSLRLWREQGAVSRKGKAFASAGMAVGFALFCWGAHPSWRLLLGVGLFFAVSAGYVLSRPAPRLEPTPLVEVDDAQDPRAARAARRPLKLMETETMLPADLAPVAAPALTPWGMYLAADVVVKAVMIALALASLATWTVLLAKGWELARQARQLRAARAVLLQAPSLPDGGVEGSLQQGIAQAMLDAARTELRLSQDLDSRDGIKERVASRLDRIELESARVQRRGIGVLASIGAVAPFVGLFGTVWGIMNSFIGIAHSNTTNLAVVAPGIAEALLATALGLVAAIPAVLVYNHFSRVLASLRGLLGDLSAAVQQLVSRDLDRVVPRTAATPLRAVH